ncbi:MAG: Holliday junction resolvase RuvX [Lacisediminihabitans sp.]
MRPGVRLGVDVGKVRIGVARSDMHGMLATPVATVVRNDDSLSEIIRLAGEEGAIEIVVGLPLALSGAHTASTNDATGFADALSRLSTLPVRLVDERLSTVSAQRVLKAAGRNVRSSRPIIDQVAAVIILQHALDFERSAGNPPGVLVHPDEGFHRGE